MTTVSFHEDDTVIEKSSQDSGMMITVDEAGPDDPEVMRSNAGIDTESVGEFEDEAKPSRSKPKNSTAGLDDGVRRSSIITREAKQIADERRKDNLKSELEFLFSLFNANTSKALKQIHGNHPGAKKVARVQTLASGNNFKLEQSRPYVPQFVVDFFSKRKKKLESEHQEILNACLMFADVSGFSKLAAALAKKGGQKSKGEDENQVGRGAEELVEHLNVYFQEIIDQVTRWGGDIIKFAGDALLVVFDTGSLDASKEQMADMVFKATQCAMGLHNIPTSKRTVDNVTLSLHVGIGSGKCRFLFVGGQFNRWEYLLADGSADIPKDKMLKDLEAEGLPQEQLRKLTPDKKHAQLLKAYRKHCGLGFGPIEQMGAAEKNAPGGTTVLSKESYLLVQDRILKRKGPLQEEADGPPCFMVLKLAKNMLTAPPKSDEPLDIQEEHVPLIEAFVPAAVRGFLDTGASSTSKWMCDLRRVTVLFINLEGLVQNDEYLGRLQKCMKIIQSCLYQEEGSVNKFLADDKGTTLIGGFGLPPLSHKDDPLRGVRAALNMMREMLEEFEGERNEEDIFSVKSDNILPSIGICTGQCFCGIVGGSRREYTMMGDVVNMSARLMQASNGNITVDRETYNASVHEINYDILPTIKVKGKTERLEIFCPDPDKNVMHESIVREGKQTPFVGREEHLDKMLEKQEKLKAGFDAEAFKWNTGPQGRGSVVHITGELGIGKTRLVKQYIDSIVDDLRDPQAFVTLSQAAGTDRYSMAMWVPIITNLLVLKRDHDDYMTNVTSSGMMDKCSLKHFQEFRSRDMTKTASWYQERHQTEKMDRATPANLVMREFKRYARVRSKPNPRLKNAFIQGKRTSSLQEVLKRMCEGDENLAGAVPLFLELLQVAEKPAENNTLATDISETSLGPDELVPCAKVLQGDEDAVKETKRERQKNRDRIFGVLKHIISEVAKIFPLTIVLDNVSGADTMSWECISTLLSWNELPVALILCERVDARDRYADKRPGDPLGSYYEQVDNLDGSSQIYLDNLDEDTTNMFCQERFDVPRVPTDVRSVLWKQSEGNPLFCERLIDQTLENGFVKVENFKAEATETLGGQQNSERVIVIKNTEKLKKVHIGEDLRTMLRARLDTLRPKHQRTLKMAACISTIHSLTSLPVFTFYGLVAADEDYSWSTNKESNKEVLSESLQYLVKQKIIEYPCDEKDFKTFEGNQDNKAYKFKSNLFREVVYMSIPFAERTAMHKVLARVNEFQISMNRDKVDREVENGATESKKSKKHHQQSLEVLAAHYNKSKESRSAFQAEMRAGLCCLDNNMEKRATDHLEQAMLSYDTLKAEMKAKGGNDKNAIKELKYMGAVTYYKHGETMLRLSRVKKAQKSIEKSLKLLNISIPQTKPGIEYAILHARAKKLMRRKVKNMTFSASSGPSSPKIGGRGITTKGAKNSLTTGALVTQDAGAATAGEKRNSFSLLEGMFKTEQTVDDGKKNLEWTERTNRLLAHIYTSLAVAYYESNNPLIGDMGSALAIAKSKRTNDAQIGLVSLSYAHACVTSLINKKPKKAASYKAKAIQHLFQLSKSSSTHVSAKIEVLQSLSEYEMARGNWREAERDVKESIEVAIESDDERMWEKGSVQLSNIYLLTGRQHTAIKVLQSVYKHLFNAKLHDNDLDDYHGSAAELSALHGISWALLMLDLPELAYQVNKEVTSPAVNKSLWQWYRNESQNGLVEVQRMLTQPESESSQTMLTVYLNLVGALDTLFAQWVRLLYVSEKKPSSKDSQPVLLSYLGMAQVENRSERKKKKRRSTVIKAADFRELDVVDDLDQISNREEALRRLVYVREPFKKLLKRLQEYKCRYGFAESTYAVYCSVYNVLNGCDDVRDEVLSLWKGSMNMLPKDEMLARVLTIAALNYTKDETLVKEHADGITSCVQRTCSYALYYNTLNLYQSSPELQGLPCNSSAEFAVLLHGMQFLQARSKKNKPVAITFSDVDLLHQDSEVAMDPTHTGKYDLGEDDRLAIFKDITDAKDVLTSEEQQELHVIHRAQAFKNWMHHQRRAEETHSNATFYDQERLVGHRD